MRLGPPFKWRIASVLLIAGTERELMRYYFFFAGMHRPAWCGQFILMIQGYT